MHSIKNTVVAVGLLGLSFVFYQLSSSNPPADESASALHDGSLSGLPVLPPLDEPSPEPIPPVVEERPEPLEPIAEPVAEPIAGADTLDVPELKPEPRPTLPPPGVLHSPQTLPPAGSANLLSQSEVRDESLIEALPLDEDPPGFRKNPFMQESPLRDDVQSNVLRAFPQPGDQTEVRATGGSAPVSRLPSVSYAESFGEALRLVQAEEYQTALRLMTRFYDTPEQTPEQKVQQMKWLNSLATKVIFSVEDHLTGAPYVVQAGDTLETLAEQWEVPARLIYNVNRQRIAADGTLPAGTALKRIPGPFHARIDLQQRRLTLFLQDMYAGEYVFKPGISGQLKPGTFRVVLKSEEGFEWRDAQNNAFPPDSPENGYGPYFIGLEGQLCIHAIEDSRQDDHNGCLGFPHQQAADLFAILSESSEITIR